MALVLGDIDDGTSILVRAHSECLTGDVFGSWRCDCSPQLETAMARIAAEGRGVVLYLRGHEGEGIGLIQKLQAYHLQDLGADTVDANVELGLPPDARDYGIGAQVLADLGIRSMRLLTNNPAKHAGMEGFGLTSFSGEKAVPTRPTPDNLRYLRTKRDRMGHDLPDLDAVVDPDQIEEEARRERDRLPPRRRDSGPARGQPAPARRCGSSRWHQSWSTDSSRARWRRSDGGESRSRRWSASRARSSWRWPRARWPISRTTRSSRSVW